MTRLQDLQKQVIKIRVNSDIVPDLKRDNSNLYMIMDEKASKMQIDGLSKELQNNYPSMRVFSNLQKTVSVKAEWEDLNDTIKKLQTTIETAEGNS